MKKLKRTLSKNKRLMKNAMILLVCIVFTSLLKCIELQNRNSKRAVEKRLQCIEQLLKENHQKQKKAE
ncbi:hypothetical protein [Polaribacter cellanae]|uniref:Uncharacterized protein n=1 Tax=Polaribacter cellanae TaxID=2818493 RepID=A0A975H5N3_9FLAO|nr:hypothetical protein [Polaribacter cellanae]QTE21118.1 hypothetical protein J3359_09670 [Polaribacter cellanae]